MTLTKTGTLGLQSNQTICQELWPGYVSSRLLNKIKTTRSQRVSNGISDLASCVSHTYIMYRTLS